MTQVVDVAHTRDQIDGLGKILSRILATNSRQIMYPHAFASLIESVGLSVPNAHIEVASYDAADALPFGAPSRYQAIRDRAPVREAPVREAPVREARVRDEVPLGGEIQFRKFL
jgi:hypothetical protein